MPGDIRTLTSLLLKKDLEGFKKTLIKVNLKTIDEQQFEGFTVLQHAIIQGQRQFVDELLDKNVNVNVGKGGKKPVLLAAEYGRCKILESFMDVKRQWTQKVNLDVSTEKKDKGEKFGGEENVLHLGNKDLKNYFKNNLKSVKLI